MAFFGFGRKQEVKKPLTDPLNKGSSERIAELPQQDILEDKGLPSTPSITSSESSIPEIGSREKRAEDFFNEPMEEAKKSPGYQAQQSNISEKDIELISSKLDYLKAAIDNLSQRLERFEGLVKEDQEKYKYRW